MSPKVLIAAGGTGGHIFPAVGLAQALKGLLPQATILFAGAFSPAMSARLKGIYGFDAKRIAAARMPRSFGPGVILFCARFLLSLAESMAIIYGHKPDIIVSMGGFSGGPFALAGRLFRRPVLIHEQNYALGRANRLSAYLAAKIAVSFSGTLDELSPALRKKAVCTGNPVRSQFFGPGAEAGRDFFGFEPWRFVILVMGGSQGSSRINRVFVEAAKGLDKNRFAVLHIAGEADFEFVSRAYEGLGLPGRVFKFLDRMEAAYAASSLVVSRSGAATVAELAASSRPSVLIPYPFGGAHQAQNARALAGAGAARMIEQKDLTAGGLLKLIKILADDRPLLEQMARKSAELARPDAARRLADEVLALL